MKHNRTLLCSLLLTALLGAAGCSSSKKVNLNVDCTSVLDLFDEGTKVDSLLVQYMTPDGEFVTIGHADVAGHSATFSGKVSEPDPVFGRLYFYLSGPAIISGSAEGYFVLEPGNITADDMDTFRGSTTNDVIYEAKEKLAQCADNPQAVHDLIVDFQEKQPTVATVFLLLRGFRYLNLEGQAAVMELINDDVMRYSNIQNLSKYVKTALIAKRAQEATAPGARYKDIPGTWDGKEYRLSDFVEKGKYVLVDFWASWCGPCKAEIPNIISVYDKYGRKGLDVIGIAVNDDPDDLAKAVENLRIPYTVFNDTENYTNQFYGIRNIPHIILIGPDGTILENNLRGEGIEDAVKKYLN